MIVDAHTHIFPDEVREERRRFFDGEDAFRLLYEPDRAAMAGVDDLLSCMDEQGVEMAVTFGFPWRNQDLARRHNDYIIESQLRHPDRIAGLCCVDIYSPDPAREVERCLEAGLYGAGELACYTSGIDEDALKRLSPVMEVCRSHKKPVMIHTNEPVGHSYPGKTEISIRQIYDLASAFPENRIVLAHWGGGVFFFNLLKREAKEVMKNLWFDTAASPFLYDPAVYTVACMSAGKDKILFGTDFPLLKPSRYFSELKDAQGLSQDERKAILGENAKELFGLGS